MLLHVHCHVVLSASRIVRACLVPAFLKPTRSVKLVTGIAPAEYRPRFAFTPLSRSYQGERLSQREPGATVPETFHLFDMAGKPTLLRCTAVTIACFGLEPAHLINPCREHMQSSPMTNSQVRFYPASFPCAIVLCDLITAYISSCKSLHQLAYCRVRSSV